ncbi:uncharacterized protein PHALS_14791 [Plasmopara halstedii]|uniref:RxLR-like protein n=1 Tax=Plasmopara halstedii TaxID=4781 RepID=A0A0P1AT62_PLAHL|nr:uncharacterized protein PHALS_14791 [Plasmopara halstedii]CEG45210.1 hypothetical protein PHALS_14791 [Plasmopara halstedii]|eukprot:XP_024581579.1 hypothetical protein PHALS_14791 [Plasmopara halstedii]
MRVLLCLVIAGIAMIDNTKADILDSLWNDVEKSADNFKEGTIQKVEDDTKDYVDNAHSKYKETRDDAKDLLDNFRSDDD